jgi:uncharacterized protein (TIRG00374 family)
MAPYPPMTAGPHTEVVASAERAEAPVRPAGLLLLDAESGRRNRRTFDAVLLAAAVLVVVLQAAVATYAAASDADIASALVTLLGWAPAVWRVAFAGLLILAVIVIVDVLYRRRWLLARDIVVAILVVFALGFVLGRIVESHWLVAKAGLLRRWGFPELRLALAIAVLAVAAPELHRFVRIIGGWLIALAVVGSVVLGAARPSSALAALAVGLGTGSLVGLLLGTAAGVPPSARVRAALSSLGVTLGSLSLSPLQHMGAAEYVGEDAAGRPVRARVLGRDAQDTQRLVRRWRQLAYRDPPRSVAVGRLEQVEHEALALFMAAQAGVTVPEVVTAALGEDGDAIVVTREPDVPPVEEAAPDDISDAMLTRLWEQVGRLHAAGISHGRLNLSNVLLVDGEPEIRGLANATLGAPQSALDIDVAELLVACTVLVGPERALPTAIDGIGTDAVKGALPYLQRAALTPHVRDLARAHEVALKKLRNDAATAVGVEKPPELVPIHRMRLRDLLTTAALAVAAYLVITQLAQIGFHQIGRELRSADVAWLVLALVVAQLPYLGGAISLRGSVLTPLPLFPSVVLHSAIKFINMTVPSDAGQIAISTRYLQRMGAPLSAAVVSGAVASAVSTIVQVLIVLLTLPLIHVDSAKLGVGTPSTRLIVAVLLALAVTVVVVLAVPKLRDKVVPLVKTALQNVWAVARMRRKRLELFGGSLLGEVFYALALGAVCLAYSVHLSLAELLFANTAASALSGLIPTPGGVGAAEATLTACLSALGVETSTAFAIAFTHRLCTYYLPPVWGYASLQWLERKGYV